MHACVRDVFAIYDHNILPWLKMIIIKIVILYFIQIRHTDDFPSTRTRLVYISCYSNHSMIFLHRSFCFTVCGTNESIAIPTMPASTLEAWSGYTTFI